MPVVDDLIFIPDDRPVMFDIDGCFADFELTFRTECSEADGVEYPAATQWHFYRDWGWGDAEFKERFDAWARSGGYTRVAEIPGSFDAARYLIELGQTVHFLTTRHHFAEHDTRAWLADRLPGHGWTLEVVSGAKLDGDRFSAAIDDHIDNVETLTATGCDAAALYRHPSNADAPSTMNRFGSIQEFVDDFVVSRMTMATEVASC